MRLGQSFGEEFIPSGGRGSGEAQLPDGWFRVCWESAAYRRVDSLGFLLSGCLLDFDRLAGPESSVAAPSSVAFAGL